MTSNRSASRPDALPEPPPAPLFVSLTRQPVAHPTATMFATLARLSKASRRALTPKRGNKDYYKGASLSCLQRMI